MTPCFTEKWLEGSFVAPLSSHIGNDSHKSAALRITGSQNWLFGDLRPLLYTSKRLFFAGSSDSYGEKKI